MLDIVRRRRLLTLAVAAVAAAVPACSSTPCPVVRHPNSRSVLSAQHGLRSWVTNVRAEARVEQRGRGGRMRGTVLMMLERPDHVRFDVLSPFGPVAVLTSNGRTFGLADMRRKRFVVGPPCRENVGRLLGVPLAADEVATVLMGDTPLLPSGERESLSCADGSYRVRLESEGMRQELEFDVRESDTSKPPSEQRLRLRRAEVYTKDGRLKWRSTYDDYRVVRAPHAQVPVALGVAMPFSVHVEAPDDKIDTLIRFKEIEVNVAIPPEAFVQSAPPGMRVESVQCAPARRP